MRMYFSISIALALDETKTILQDMTTISGGFLANINSAGQKVVANLRMTSAYATITSVIDGTRETVIASIISVLGHAASSLWITGSGVALVARRTCSDYTRHTYTLTITEISCTA